MTALWAQNRADNAQMLGPRSRSLLSSTQAPQAQAELDLVKHNYRSIPNKTSHYTKSEMSTWHTHQQARRIVASFPSLNIKKPISPLTFHITLIPHNSLHSQTSPTPENSFFTLFLSTSHITRYFPSVNLYCQILTQLTDCIVWTEFSFNFLSLYELYFPLGSFSLPWIVLVPGLCLCSRYNYNGLQCHVSLLDGFSLY